MSIKQAIEALEVAQDALDISQSLQESAKSNHHPKTLAAYERVSAALAALRSMPAEPVATLPNIDVDVMLRTIFELCEATVEAPEITPKNEHERGFDRGRRFEAKSIQKTTGQWFQHVFCGRTFMGEPCLKKPNVPHCVDGACHLCVAPQTAPLTDAEIQAIWSAKDTPQRQSKLSAFGLDRIRAIEQVIRGAK